LINIFKLVKDKAMALLGYIFCALSFRWFDAVELPYGDEWSWRHRASYFIGEQLYSVGRFFYDLDTRREKIEW
jgi:hypothetical protein